MTVKISLDKENQMLMIEKDSNLLFYGNYWDFKIPTDIEQIIRSLTPDVEVVFRDSEEW